MTESLVLDNGLRLVVEPTSAAPLAAIYLWIDAGSSAESDAEAGAAHFLEHMVFKGTERRAMGRAAAEIEALGGDLNAYTTYGQTVVHATVQSDAWEQALDVVLDMVRNSVFDPAEVERERQVILEEIRSYQDDPESVVSDVLAEHSYPGHPYGRPILGTLDTVSALTREQLVAFWRRHYHPRQALISIAGDVGVEAVHQAVERLTHDWVPGEVLPRPTEARAPKPGVHKLNKDFETTAVELAWRCPALGHPDLAALDVLSSALGDGGSSALTVRLQLEEKVASDVIASLTPRRSGSDLTVAFLPREGQTAHALTVTLDEIGKIASRGLTPAQVARARAAVLADFLFGEETVDGLAHDNAWFTARFGSPESRRTYRTEIAAVTAADVERVAREWLDPQKAVVVVLDTEMHETVSLPARPKSPPRDGPSRIVFDNGATLWVLPDGAPVAAIRAVGLGGALGVDARHAGLHTLWSRAVTEAAGGLDATAYAEAVDDIAGSLHGSAGAGTVSLSASFPAESIERGLELFGMALVDPHFDPEDVDRLRDELIEEVRTLPDRASEIGRDALWARLWPGHPWRLPPLGTEASLDNIRAQTLQRYHRRWICPENLVIAVAGGVEADRVTEALAPWIEGLEKSAWSPPDLPLSQPRYGIARRRAGREQAWVTWAARGVSTSDPMRPALLVAAGMLSAQGGRLFLPLREERGLAYSVWARSVNSWGGGHFEAGLATDPSRAEEARDALLAELRRFVSEPPSQHDVADAKRMLVGQAAMGLQRATGRAGDAAVYERLGLPRGIDGFARTLAPVDADAVRAAMAQVLDEEGLTVIVEPTA